MSKETNLKEEKDLVKEGIEIVFSHRESFIVVSLTGRTGSGCTTVAEILKEDFDIKKFPTISSPPKNNEDRKDNIIFNWTKKNWKKFNCIQVSQIILLLGLEEEKSKFFEFIGKESPKIEDFNELINDFDLHHEKAILANKTLKNIKTSSDEDISKSVKFIFECLPEYHHKVKKVLGYNYTKIFQLMGDNIRKSGSVIRDQPNPSKILILPEKIHRIIKLVRYNHKNKNNYFVIDALRHPFEIRYLRERISALYVVAVSTDEENRSKRLYAKGFDKEEIESLDQKEYPLEKDPKSQEKQGYNSFVSQNIQACLELADIHIRNNETDNNHFVELRKNIYRYIALMQHPGLITPTNIERCMQIAHSLKLNSGCISRQVGAVVTDKDFSVKAVGWNDVPRGQVSCNLRNTSQAIRAEDKVAYSEFEIKNDNFRKNLISIENKENEDGYINGRNTAYCFKSLYNKTKGDNNQVHTRALHAEENAFIQISKYGGSGLEGGFLFSTASPCELCAKKSYQIGIKKIVYIDPYPGITRPHIIAVGNKKPEFELFSGAIGRAYHELYEPIMPYKDELKGLLISQ